ncbi:unnamed protein product [Ilex paraguariensis]|uniref:Uncharacterized protein n=1 Tax=Ilex paraguariensis TaxID=185542 RepID=A0ABC8UYQ4_9AQUA
MRIQTMMNNLQDKLRGMGAENMMNNLQVKLKEVGADSMMNNVQDKQNQLFLMLENFGLYFIAWLDKVFPPETRGERLHYWLQVAAPFIIAGLILLVCLRCCIRCCRCCGRGGKVAVKMMKAPGRNFRMPREVFESNPRSYFLQLREKTY